MNLSKYILILLCVILSGCPIPAYYKIDDTKAGNYSVFSNEIRVHLKAGHPWFDSGKKFIVLNTVITNEGKEARSLNLSELSLYTNRDSFRINYGQIHAKNKFAVKQQSIELVPGQPQEITLFYVSDDNYTKREYLQSIERDTLVYSFIGHGEQLLLIGKRN